MKSVLTKFENNVLSITLNKPDKHNAFDNKMIKHIYDLLIKEKKNLDIKTLVIKGNGKSFCSGIDMKTFQNSLNKSREENFNDSHLIAKCFNEIYHFPVPTISLIKGYSLGGACGFIAASDYVIAESNTTTISMSEVKNGIVPACVSPFVIKKIGMAKTKLLMLSGQRINAKTAKEYGLVSTVSENIELELEKTIKNLNTGVHSAILSCKKMLLELETMEEKNKLSYVAKVLTDIKENKQSQIASKNYKKN